MVIYIYMVNIWLMMIYNDLVGGFNPTPLKNDGVRQRGWDDIAYMKWKIKFMFQTTNQPWKITIVHS